MGKVIIISICIFFIGCTGVKKVQKIDDLIAVDNRSNHLKNVAQGENLIHILSIDHSRLAQKENADLAASKVDFYSNVLLNTELLCQNISVGLDLPVKILSYVENNKLKTVYTDSIFLKIRHDLVDSKALVNYKHMVRDFIGELPNSNAVNSEGLSYNYGIIKLESDYDFKTTVSNIKRDVLEEGDTKWFLTLDYQKEAMSIGKSLPNSKLLIFGAPSPGAKAMRDFMSIGVDVFPQKVYVYTENEKVIVAYNDIVEMSNLHYTKSTFIHRIINFRLGSVLSNAVEK